MINSNPALATIVLGAFLGAAFTGGVPPGGTPGVAGAPAVKPLPPASARPAPATPAPLPAPPRPRPWLAAAEVAGINVGVWAFLHYFANAHYSYISWDTMADNVRDSWEWDQSRYFVNFYHHPYHGYLYYNAGRANGLGYWGSYLSAFGGSLMWEMVMEKYRPSINDLITTTNGGCVYGEVGYRLSALVRDRGARGLDRVWREAVAGILDPVGAVNRLLNGRNDDVPGSPGRADDETPFHGELLLAGPVVFRNGQLAGAKAVPLVAFDLRFGEPGGPGWSGKPYDAFSVQGRLRWGPDRPHLSLSIGGFLAGKILPAAGSSSHLIGVYQYYEYYGFDTLRIGNSSFAGGLTSIHALGPKTRLRTSVRLGWLALGGADDFYYTGPERRQYNYGTGWIAGAEAGLGSTRFQYISASWRHYGLFILQGQKGSESWDIFQGEVRVPVWRKLGAGLQLEYWERNIRFTGLEPGERRLIEARAFLTCQF